MSLSGHVGGLAKSASLWVGLALAVLCISLGGVAFLVAGFDMFLSARLGDAQAAAITGATLFVLASLIGLCGGLFLKRMRQKQPGLLSGFGGGLGIAMQLIGMIVRRDPKKAMIAAVIAGALAEYFAADRKS